jgi:hypothetical protein
MMAGLIVLRPGLDWTATGGLFDWTLEFLIPRLADQEAVERLREIVANNLGSLWISEFSPETRRDIAAHLRNDLVPIAERELPASDRKVEAIQHLQELADLAGQVDNGD